MSDTHAEDPVRCPHAERCAGCPLIELPYAEQLDRKRERLARSIERFAGIAVELPAGAVAADPIVGYRTRAKLVVDRGRLGLYARGGGHEVVDIPGCRVLSPPLVDAAAAVRALLAEPPAPARDLVASLSAVDLREARDEGTGRESVLATLVVDDDTPADEAAASAVASFLQERAPQIALVATSRRRSRSPRVLGGSPEVVHGDATLDDVVRSPGGSLVRVPALPGGFVQAHRGQAERIARRIADALRTCGIAPERARIVDAFAGAGAFGLAFARDGADVVLIESHAPSLDAARDAAADQSLRVRAIQGDASAVLGALADEGVSVDAVIVDPPRRGLSPDARRAAARLAPRMLAYVSCDPDTLARDLDHFARLGLAARSVEAFDMIPLSDEVEAVAILEPSPPPPPRVLFDDGGLVAIDKPPHEPTTPQGEWTGSLLDRVRALPGLAEAVPIHRLDAGTSGVCLFARRGDAAAAWTAALLHADATKEYAVLARGIARDHGTVRRPLEERGKKRDAFTRYRRVEVAGSHSLLSVRIETGRTHQIRRHLASIGHPVLGDARHGHAPSNRHFEERYALDRPFIHSALIELPRPDGSGLEKIASELPGDLRAVLDRLRARRTR